MYSAKSDLVLDLFWAQEKVLIINDPVNITKPDAGMFEVDYSDKPQPEFCKNWPDELKENKLDFISQNLRCFHRNRSIYHRLEEAVESLLAGVLNRFQADRSASQHMPTGYLSAVATHDSELQSHKQMQFAKICASIRNHERPPLKYL